MIVRDVQEILESWAPRSLAWERDNVGLQVGSLNRHVRGILVTLDVTDRVVDEARRKRTDLIVSHHPLLFHPPKTVDTQERVGRLISMLLQSRISLFAVHTNLDFAAGGVSFALAERLGLRDVEVLQPHQSVQSKIVVYVPPAHLDRVTTAMADAGAGVIGEYDSCSFRTTGTGTFRPLKGAKPYIGRSGRLERVEEVRLEMIAPRWQVPSIVEAMRSAHPYEEAAYDVYDLSNTDGRSGAGAIGHLPRKSTLKEFLQTVQRVLEARGLRYSGRPSSSIGRVAVCGGSGSSYLAAAIRSKADAFVTADVGYHAHQECDGRIALIDAGHFETEMPIVPKLAKYLAAHPAARRARIRVHPSRTPSNFVQYHLP